MYVCVVMGLQLPTSEGYLLDFLPSYILLKLYIMYVPIRNPKVSVARFNFQTKPPVVADFQEAVKNYNTRNLYT